MYIKLEHLGFGGRTLQIIKSMYCNDSLKFLINGKFTDSLWISQGVKQGKMEKIIEPFPNTLTYPRMQLVSPAL